MESMEKQEEGVVFRRVTPEEVASVLLKAPKTIVVIDVRDGVGPVTYSASSH